MAQVQAADHDAFRALVARHATALHRFAYRLMRNSSDAEDVAQETFLRVWQRAATWETDRVRFSTWLFRIAHNLCVDRFRRDARLTTLAPTVLAAVIDDGVINGAASERAASDHAASDGATVSSASDGAASIDAATRRAHVQRALAALPERQRTALALCFYQGFSNQEAAAILDVSVDALESLLSRARRTLRTQLAEHAGGGGE